MSLPAVLLAWYHAGVILGFAPVDHTDPAAVDAAMQAFKGIYAGVDLTGDADDLFSRQLPWTTENGEQPDTSEGHCVVKVYAGDPASQGAEDGYVTWGAFQKATMMVWRSVRAGGDTKTCKSRRTIALPGHCVSVLREHHALVLRLKADAGGLWQENDLVFPSRSSGSLS